MRELLFDPKSWMLVGVSSRRALRRYLDRLNCQILAVRHRPRTFLRAYRDWQLDLYRRRLRRESSLYQPLLLA